MICRWQNGIFLPQRIEFIINYGHKYYIIAFLLCGISLAIVYSLSLLAILLARDYLTIEK